MVDFAFREVIETLKEQQQRDKRINCRVIPRHIIMVSFRHRDANPGYGVAKDISELGVRLRTDVRLALNQHIRLAIPVTADRTRVLIKPEARVVWTNTHMVNDVSGDSLDVGLRFTRIDDSHRRRLIRIFENCELWSNSYRSAKTSRSSVLGPQLPETSSAREVLVVAVGGHVERICAAIDMAGLAPVVVGSIDAMCAWVASHPPALVILFESLGARSFSDAARHIKRIRSSAVPVVCVVNTAENPWGHAIRYPVEATLDPNLDLVSLAKTVRLVAASGKIGDTQKIVETREPPALQGDLFDDDLCSVLQFLFVTRKRGRVTVHISKRTGQMFVNCGNLTHCSFGDSSGRDAFIECVTSRPPGYFLFATGLEPAVATMNESGLELLLEANRQRDHRARVVGVETASAISAGDGYQTIGGVARSAAAIEAFE